MMEGTSTMNKTPFSVNPASANTGVLDYKKKAACTLYEKASAKLTSDEFDCTADHLHDLMATLKIRAAEFGWEKRIMGIPVTNPDGTTEVVSLLESPGRITMEAIVVHECSYLNSTSRKRQDMDCLFKCLMASLSREGRNRILMDRKKYTLEDKTGQVVFSGNLFLKAILAKSTVDNRSGETTIHM